MFPIPVGSPSALATRANAVPGVVRTVALAAGVLAAGAVIPALAQATRHEARPAVRAVPPVARDAVTAPVAPDVINRDASGRVAIRATRLDTALTIDGHLDESTYRQVKSFGGFVQQEPQEGRPSSVSTDVWVFFDKQLGIDLGGVHGADSRSVNLDTLFGPGKAAGNYIFDFFFAERHTSESNLRIETSLTLLPPSQVPEPASFALVLAGMAGMGWVGRRRRS